MIVANKMCGKHLITKSTPTDGLICRSVMIAEEIKHNNKYFTTLKYDSRTGGHVLIYSQQGSYPLERLMTMSPHQVHFHPIDFAQGIDTSVAKHMGEVFSCDEQAPVIAELITNMYKCFIERDLLELTINPLVLTTDKELIPLVVSVEVDENAVYRQAELFAMKDYSQMTKPERLTALCDYNESNYVRLSDGGNIGVVTNGAGMGLATCDLIELQGGKAHNFLDLSGGGTHEQIIEVLHMLNENPKVKVILINIFGSIFGANRISESLVLLSKHFKLNKFFVCRIRGKWEKEAKDQLIGINSDKIILIDDFESAVQTSVDIAALNEHPE